MSSNPKPRRAKARIFLEARTPEDKAAIIAATAHATKAIRAGDHVEIHVVDPQSSRASEASQVYSHHAEQLETVGTAAAEKSLDEQARKRETSIARPDRMEAPTRIAEERATVRSAFAALRALGFRVAVEVIVKAVAQEIAEYF